jgi:hypothetical protein
MADADNLAKLLRYQAARVPLRLRQMAPESQGPRGCGALTKCRRRDSNPRHADYDSRPIWLGHREFGAGWTHGWTQPRAGMDPIPRVALPELQGPDHASRTVPLDDHAPRREHIRMGRLAAGCRRTRPSLRMRRARDPDACRDRSQAPVAIPAEGSKPAPKSSTTITTMNIARWRRRRVLDDRRDV